ncbi:MAG: mannose-1-phosphate guanylyltransferase [Deltaproteobacteria bacterium]|nr:mannose-1-phosphate guanylyltransferase [Deltaproteobacteria bacterium]
MNSHFYVVILAGGEGTRFAPLSSPEKPKQFLPIVTDSRTMIQETYGRISSLVPESNIFVSTNERYLSLVRDQLPSVPGSCIIGEPVKKNTAPPMALLARLIFEQDPKAVLSFFPADHYIDDSGKAVGCFRKAALFAAEEPILVTFGIVPEFPSTEYGYIRKEGACHPGGASKVLSFFEKPDLQRAEGYLKAGDYFWNSGMFVWKAAVFLDAVRKQTPRLSSLLDGISFQADGSLDPTFCRHYFEKAESISVDYAIMEKADNVMMFPFDAGWSDVGTWKGLKDLARRFNLQLPAEVKSHLSRM